MPEISITKEVLLGFTIPGEECMANKMCNKRRAEFIMS
jgi:hypothetical protein